MARIRRRTCVPIIDEDSWNQVQAVLAENRQGRKLRRSASDPSLLAGLVFDGDGRRLTPTHSSKGNRRYRYYVSQDLNGRVRDDLASGLRIPAPELENAVRHGLSDYLRDSARLVADTGLSDVSACQALMGKAQEIVGELGQGLPRVLRERFLYLIDQVVVRLDRLEIRLKVEAFGVAKDAASLMIRVPVQLKRCGLGVRLILQGPGARRPGVIDDRLVRVVDRGIRWFNRMTAKVPQGIGMIAKAEGVDSSFVIRLTYLAFLAPDIVEAIRNGSHPATLTARTLTKATPLPMDWAEQRRLLGFAPNPA
jgi:site-specific DNA recombinase